jgi:hypothetical protein
MRGAHIVVSFSAVIRWNDFQKGDSAKRSRFRGIRFDFNGLAGTNRRVSGDDSATSSSSVFMTVTIPVFLLLFLLFLRTAPALQAAGADQKRFLSRNRGAGSVPSPDRLHKRGRAQPSEVTSIPSIPTCLSGSSCMGKSSAGSIKYSRWCVLQDAIF